MDYQENAFQASLVVVFTSFVIILYDHGTTVLANAMVSLHPTPGTIVVLPQRPQSFVDVPCDSQSFSLLYREIENIDIG
jgi:hypothetical protein